MKETQTQRLEIPVDDIKIGTRMTVLQNEVCYSTGHEWDYLKGAVLQVVVISLPYLLAEAFDSVRGTATLSIDVRKHIFARINDEYADAVIAVCKTDEDDEVPF